MSRSTVYRVIPLLLQACLIFVVSVREGREEQVYENTLGPRHHDHLTCENCGAVIEFNESEVHKLLEKIAERYGFRLRSHVLHLRGLCPACQEKIIAREMGDW